MEVKDTTLVRIATCRFEDEDAEADLDVAPMEVISSVLDPSNKEEKKELAKIERKKKARRCPFPGIDMEHIESDIGLTDLHFTVKYKKMKPTAPPVKYFLRNRQKAGPTIDQLQIAAVVSEESEAAAEAPTYEHYIGSIINYNNDMYVINSVSGDRETVEVMRYYEQDNHTNIPLMQASHIINASLGRAAIPTASSN